MSTNIDYFRLPPFTDVGASDVGYQLNLFRRNRFNTGNTYDYDLLFKTFEMLLAYYNALQDKPPYAIVHNLDTNRIVTELTPR